MQENYEIIPVGAMTLTEILPELWIWTRAAARPSAGSLSSR